MPLDHAWIARHIPHHGRMCLLDAVLEWNEERIVCSAVSHRDRHNPLRAQDRLGVICGIEYAAQTMAVHGALTAGAADPTRSLSTPLAGFLASVRGVHMRVERLDDVQEDLKCCAVRLAGDAASALYEFEIRSSTRVLMDGRATVVLDGDGRLTL